MGAVQFVSGVGDQLGQSFRRGRGLDVPQFDQTLDLAGLDAVEQRPLLPAGLGNPDFIEGGFAGDGPGAIIAQRRGPLAGQQHARAGPDRDPSDGPRRDPDVHQLGQLADQRRLGCLGARGVAVHGRRPRDLEVQALDLLKQVVGPFDGALDPAVGVFPDRLDLAGDPAGLVEQGLGPEQGVLTTGRGSRILGAGGEGREHGVDLGEEAGVAARVPEQGLDAVVHFVAHAHARRLGSRVQTGRLQEAVGGEADARHLDAGAHPLAGQGLLLRDLADVAGRVDVGDVVGNDAELGLGRLEARTRRIHDGVQGHPKASKGAAPGKPCQPTRAFCPASRDGGPHKLLKLRALAFRAWVISNKKRKRRANRGAGVRPARAATTELRRAPGKNRLHAASFD